MRKPHNGMEMTTTDKATDMHEARSNTEKKQKPKWRLFKRRKGVRIEKEPMRKPQTPETENKC